MGSIPPLPLLPLHPISSPALRQEWMAAYRMMLKKPGRRVQEPEGRWRLRLFRVVQSRRFDFFISGCILVNILFMATEHYNQSATHTMVIEITSFVFTVVYTLETIAKFIAYGVRGYWAKFWNRLDLAVVLISIAGAAPALAPPPARLSPSSPANTAPANFAPPPPPPPNSSTALHSVPGLSCRNEVSLSGFCFTKGTLASRGARAAHFGCIWGPSR